MFITIDEDNFKKIIGDVSKPVIVEIGASWSGACFIMEPILNQIASQYSQKIVMGRINIEGCKKIATNYGIKKLPTYLFFMNGELVDQVTGVVSKIHLISKIETLIN